jgi:hypothetical protein
MKLHGWTRRDAAVQQYTTPTSWGIVWSPPPGAHPSHSRWTAQVARRHARANEFIGSFATETGAKRAVERRVDRRDAPRRHFEALVASERARLGLDKPVRR